MNCPKCGQPLEEDWVYDEATRDEVPVWVCTNEECKGFLVQYEEE